MRGGKQIFRQFTAGPLRFRRPLTVDMLNKLAATASNHDDRVYTAMLYLGVFGMLRVGELCFGQAKDGTKKFIANQDVSVSKTKMTFLLRGTKTDLKKQEF